MDEADLGMDFADQALQAVVRGGRRWPNWDPVAKGFPSFLGPIGSTHQDDATFTWSLLSPKVGSARSEDPHRVPRALDRSAGQGQ